MTETKPKKKKFKYTRELVRIAIDEGMTQMEIAALCRVQQSKVSAWFRGESKALEHEVDKLKQRFGHRLNRTTSRIYLVAKQEGPESRWEDTERARRLLEIQAGLSEVNERLAHTRRSITFASGHAVYRDIDGEEPAPPKEPLDLETLKEERSELEKTHATLETAKKDLERTIFNGDSNKLSIEGLIRLVQEDFKASHQREIVTQVEGPIILRYTFVRLEPVMHGRTQELKRLPIARWLIHVQHDGKFVLVTQARRTLVGSGRWRWWNALRIAGSSIDRNAGERDFFNWKDDVHVECADDAARWSSSIHGPMDSAALLSHCDQYFSDPSALHSPHDESTLPFLLKKMLVEQGAEVPGLARIVDLE